MTTPCHWGTLETLWVELYDKSFIQIPDHSQGPLVMPWHYSGHKGSDISVSTAALPVRAPAIGKYGTTGSQAPPGNPVSC